MQDRSYQSDLNAIADVLAQWHSDNPDLNVLALVAESSQSLIPHLQQQACDLGLSLYCGVFPELLVDGAFKREGILLFRLQHASKAVLLPCNNAQQDARSLYDSLHTQIDKEEDDTLFLIFDSMVPHIASLLDELYLKFADRVKYVGVNAGSETFQPIPCLFNEQQLIGHGMLAFLLHQHAGSLLRHGYEISKLSMHSATTTEGNCIVQINWQPAFEVYRELVMQRFGQEITKDNFYEYGVHFPFGLLRANGEVIVRIPVALADDDSLFCVGEVPANSMVTVLDAEPALLSEATSALGKTVAKRGWQSTIAFYCAGRRMHLGSEAAALEMQLLSHHIGQVDGALSLGEIGNLQDGDCPLFHNGTLICCDWTHA